MIAQVHDRSFTSCRPLSIRVPAALLALAYTLVHSKAAPPPQLTEAVEVGKPLSAWTEGTLDIHHINTGRGDSVFFILPDGTTLLADASDGQAYPLPAPFGMPTKPDSSRQAGEWIARYITRTLRNFPEKQIDYAILSHFHGDHIGKVSPDSKRSPEGRYALTGISEIPEYVPVRRIIDRNWPDYNHPAPLELDNYRKFLAWQIEHRGLVVEQFKPGQNNQIVLRRNPSAYPAFEVRNLIANGRVWTGVGTESRQLADMKNGERSGAKTSAASRFASPMGNSITSAAGTLDAKTRVLLNSAQGWQDVEPAAAEGLRTRRCAEGQPPWQLGRQLRRIPQAPAAARDRGHEPRRRPPRPRAPTSGCSPRPCGPDRETSLSPTSRPPP
jgi:hypothetical protein